MIARSMGREAGKELRRVKLTAAGSYYAYIYSKTIDHFNYTYYNNYRLTIYSSNNVQCVIANSSE
jgi:hypothetical protein